MESGWQGRPKDAKENDVVNWFVPIIRKQITEEGVLSPTVGSGEHQVQTCTLI